MKAKERTEITVESREVTVIRYRQPISVYCEECEAETLHVSMDQAALIVSLPAPAFFHLAGERIIHSRSAANGALLVCGSSLAELGREMKLANRNDRR
ncbi:MAG: hypothetical protein ACRD6X_10960 [Pyrinomonadaceae bacterium]